MTEMVYNSIVKKTKITDNDTKTELILKEIDPKTDKLKKIINSLVKFLNPINKDICPSVIQIQHINKKNTFSFEICNRGSLNEFLTNKASFTEGEIKTFLKQWLYGISTLSKRSCDEINYDITPSYIFVHESSDPPEVRLKIKSFSLNKWIFNQIFKDFDYYPPETFVDVDLENMNMKSENDFSVPCQPHQHKNMKSKIWSLGVFIFRWLCGRTPFAAKTKGEIISNILRGNYTIPNDWKCSLEIITLINNLLQFEPSKRWSFNDISKQNFISCDEKDFHYINWQDYYFTNCTIFQSKYRNNIKSLLYEQYKRALWNWNNSNTNTSQLTWWKGGNAIDISMEILTRNKDESWFLGNNVNMITQSEFGNEIKKSLKVLESVGEVQKTNSTKFIKMPEINMNVSRMSKKEIMEIPEKMENDKCNRRNKSF